MRILSTSKQKEKGGDGQKGGLTESYLLVWLVTVAGFTDPQDLPRSSFPFPSTIWTKYIGIIFTMKITMIRYRQIVPAASPGVLEAECSEGHLDLFSCSHTDLVGLVLDDQTNEKSLESCFTTKLENIETEKDKRQKTNWIIIQYMAPGWLDNRWGSCPTERNHSQQLQCFRQCFRQCCFHRCCRIHLQMGSWGSNSW